MCTDLSHRMFWGSSLLSYTGYSSKKESNQFALKKELCSTFIKTETDKKTLEQGQKCDFRP